MPSALRWRAFGVLFGNHRVSDVEFLFRSELPEQSVILDQQVGFLAAIGTDTGFVHPRLARLAAVLTDVTCNLVVHDALNSVATRSTAILVLQPNTWKALNVNSAIEKRISAYSDAVCPL
jgi:hypothetical protein